MKRALLCFILGVSLLWVGIAYAAPPQLKGTYAFTATESGITNDVGFNGDLTPIDEASTSCFYLTHQGVATFNGDGTGTLEGSGLGHITNVTTSTPWRGYSVRFYYDFTYTVDHDGKITLNLVADSYHGTELAGIRAGQTFTINKISLSGWASQGNKVLTLGTPGTATPEIATVKYYKDSTLDATIYQIGHASHVFTWLSAKTGK
jgi:hypothetical protein